MDVVGVVANEEKPPLVRDKSDHAPIKSIVSSKSKSANSSTRQK